MSKIPPKWATISALAMGFPTCIFFLARLFRDLVVQGVLEETTARGLFLVCLCLPLLGMVFYALKFRKR